MSGRAPKEATETIRSSAARNPFEVGFYLALDLCVAATLCMLGFMAATHLLPELSIIQFHHWLHLNNITAVVMTFASRWILPLFWVAWLVTMMVLQRRFPESKSRLAIELRQYITHSNKLSNIGLGSFAVGALLGIVSLI